MAGDGLGQFRGPGVQGGPSGSSSLMRPSSRAVGPSIILASKAAFP